jgi:uncharacterized protein (DUF433 family)
MNYADYIETKPGVLGGKPVIKGTRISVELLLGWFAAGWSMDEVLENYPRVTREDLKAVFTLAHELVTEERFIIESKVA